MKNLLIEQMEAIPCPLPVSEWIIQDCSAVEVGQFVAIDFQRHPNLPVEYFDCSLIDAFNALPENGDYLVYDADHSPKVVHEWEEWTYRDGSEIELRTAKVDLFDYLREYILSDYEDAGRVILSTFSMREDFNNYLSNF